MREGLKLRNIGVILVIFPRKMKVFDTWDKSHKIGGGSLLSDFEVEKNGK